MQEEGQILLLEVVVEQHQEAGEMRHDSAVETCCSAAVVALAEAENPVLVVEGIHSLFNTIQTQNECFSLDTETCVAVPFVWGRSSSRGKKAESK